MKFDSDYFLLHPHVKLVDGKYRGALYNLFSNDILPIPKSASVVIEACQNYPIKDVLSTIEDSVNRETAEEYLNCLELWGFGTRMQTPIRVRPCIVELSIEKLHRLLFLSLDLRCSNNLVDYADILRCAHDEFMCRQICLFLSGTIESQKIENDLVDLVSNQSFHHVELVFEGSQLNSYWRKRVTELPVRIAFNAYPDSMNTQMDQFAKAGVKNRFSPLSAKPPKMDLSLLWCDSSSFKRFKSGSIHSNCLHISSSGEVFPWALEKHYHLGNVHNSCDFKSLMISENLQKAWRLTKDDIDVCKDCEFRYACGNSYTFRREPKVLHSQPSNCSYSLKDGVWE